MPVDKAKVNWWILGPSRGGLEGQAPLPRHDGDADAQKIGGSSDLQESPPSARTSDRRDVICPTPHTHTQ
eukprot:13478667-Heterocapsa_arctica.AAC.1